MPASTAERRRPRAEALLVAVGSWTSLDAMLYPALLMLGVIVVQYPRGSHFAVFPARNAPPDPLTGGDWEEAVRDRMHASGKVGLGARSVVRAVHEADDWALIVVSDAIKMQTLGEAYDRAAEITGLAQPTSLLDRSA